MIAGLSIPQESNYKQAHVHSWLYELTLRAPRLFHVSVQGALYKRVYNFTQLGLCLEFNYKITTAELRLRFSVVSLSTLIIILCDLISEVRWRRPFCESSASFITLKGTNTEGKIINLCRRSAVSY